MFLPEDTHGVNAALYPRLHATGELFGPTGVLGFLLCHPKQAICHQSSPSFSDPDRSDPCLLVQCDKMAAHHGLIGGPWGMPIAQPLREIRENQPQLPTRCPEK